MERTCGNCEHMGYLSRCSDQPNDEFWCKLGEWDGIQATDELDEETDCEHFEEKN